MLGMHDPKPTISHIEKAIRNIRIFPSPASSSRTSLPSSDDARLFAASIDMLTADFQAGMVDAVVGIDARGFIFAAAAALKLQAGFIPVRKKGKLPFNTHEQSYELEYGTNTIAIHTDALKPTSRVCDRRPPRRPAEPPKPPPASVEKVGAKILQISFVIELSFLKAANA
jgi:adenine phosphoribosyltransferase